MEAKSYRKQWKRARERDRRQARFLIRERIAVGCDNNPGNNHKNLEHTDEFQLQSILEQINVGHRSLFSVHRMHVHFTHFETLVPSGILLQSLPRENVVSRLGPRHLKRVESYLHSMASISLMEYSVLLGRYHILGALLLGGISPCLRGREEETPTTMSDFEMEEELQQLARNVLKRFFDCFPLSLSSYIYKRVVDMRIMQATMVVQKQQSATHCGICHQDTPGRFLLVYTRDSLGETPGTCQCVFCESCYWKNMLQSVGERRGDVVQCPCCSSFAQDATQVVDSHETGALVEPLDPHERYKKSMNLFRALPLDSKALKQSGRKKKKIPELEALCSHWTQAVLPSLGLCQDVRRDKLFTFTEKEALPYVKGCLEAGADVNATNEYGQSALYIATWEGNASLVKLLLEYGANPWVRANGTCRSLEGVCSAHGHFDCLRIIQEFRKEHHDFVEEEPASKSEQLGHLVPIGEETPELETLIELDEDHPGAGSYLVKNCIREVESLVGLWERLPINPSPKKELECAARSYYCDAEGWLRSALKQRIFQAFNNSGKELGRISNVIVLPHMRFLHYSHVGSKLAPHIDLHRMDSASGLRSTHSFLLYLSTCEKGGETVLLGDVAGEGRNVFLATVKPKTGTLLLFPHETPHEGAVVESVPKLLIRGEAVLIR